MENACSNSITRGPLVIHPDFKQSTTLYMSSSSMDGTEKGRNLLRLARIFVALAM